jgi:hypothetical protein
MATGSDNVQYVFATLDQHTISADTRIDWTFAPGLTLQLYAQPLRSRARFSDYKELTANRALAFSVYGRDIGSIAEVNPGEFTIHSEGNAASSFVVGGSPDEASSLSRATRFNAVLRRELRNGSVFYLVWQQQWTDARPLDGSGVGNPWGGVPGTNVVMAKFAYRFGR